LRAGRDKYEWPELKWACERAEAETAAACLLKGHGARVGGHILDLKPLTALEIACRRSGFNTGTLSDVLSVSHA